MSCSSFHYGSTSKYIQWSETLETVIDKAYVSCFIKRCTDKEGTQPDSSTREWTTGPNPSRSRDHPSLLSTLTSPSTSFLPLFSLLPLASHLIAPLPPPSLCLLSLSSSCPAVTPHFWSNDSQLSTPRRLSRPLSGPDSSTDEIAHRAPLPGPASVRAILDGSLFFFLLYLFISFLFWSWLCLVVFFVRVYFVFLCAWLFLCFFFVVVFCSLLMIWIQKGKESYIWLFFSIMSTGYLEANHHLNIRPVSCIRR